MIELAPVTDVGRFKTGHPTLAEPGGGLGALGCRPWGDTPSLAAFCADPGAGRQLALPELVWTGQRWMPQLAGAAGMTLIERYVASLNLVNSQSSFLDLPRDFYYAGLIIRLRGTLTATATTAGTLHDENPWSYANRIKVDAAGGGAALTFKDARGVHFARIHHLLMGTEPNRQPLTAAGTQTGTAWSAIIPVWFALPGGPSGLVPEIGVQSILDPSEFSALRLEIQAGTAADFINGGTYTVGPTVNSPIADVYAIQVVNVSVARQRPYRYQEQFYLRDSLSATATARRFSNPIPTGKSIRYVLLRTTNEASNTRQPVDDTLGAIQLLVSQTMILRYQDFREYAQRNRETHAVQAAVNPAGLNPASSVDNPAVGYYMFDFAKDGRLEGVLDASRYPARGIPIDLLHDVLTASARQIDVVLGFLIPGMARSDLGGGGGGRGRRRWVPAPFPNNGRLLGSSA